MEFDFSDLSPEMMFLVGEELKKGVHAQLVQSELDSMRQLDNRQEARSIDGIGELQRRIPIESYIYWSNRLGQDCWADKQFLKEFDRDNPQCRVRAKGTRLQVGYGGLSGKGHVVKRYS